MGERTTDFPRLFAGPFPALEERLLSRLPESFGRVRGREDVLLGPSNELREHLLGAPAARGGGGGGGGVVGGGGDRGGGPAGARGGGPEGPPVVRVATPLPRRRAENRGRGGDVPPEDLPGGRRGVRAARVSVPRDPLWLLRFHL